MMRREALDTSNAYSAEYRNVEDYALFIRLSQTARIANLPEILLLYRTWRKSASRQPDHEYQAMRVLRDAVLALGIEISDDQAYALHGLSRDRYPSRIEDIRSVAQLVRTLRGLYLQRVARERLDRIAIDSDAAVRLWLLGALAARRSLPLALSLMSAAMRIRPISLVSFASKVLRRFAMS